MANEPENTIASQIGELRSQLSTLSAELAEKLGTATGKADDALASASSAFDDVAASARFHGSRALNAAKENPGAASTALATIGIVGLLAGIFLGRCRR